MNLLPYILITLLFSAFFSVMEIAFISSNKLRLEITKKENKLSSKILSHFSEYPSRYISTMLVGNNIALVIYGILMATLLKPDIARLVNDHDGLILLIQTIISTLIILVFAEFIPKVLFKTVSNQSLKLFAVPLAFFYMIFYPIVRISLWLSTLGTRLLGVKIKNVKQALVLSKVDLDDFISESNGEHEEEDSIDKELKIFQNALDFGDIRLRECMVPRTDIVAVDLNTDIPTLTQQFIESGYSKIFIFKDNIDSIVGYVRSHDLFKNPGSLKTMLRKPLIVPETMKAQDMLTLFIKENKNITVVVDEFGGTSGIVSIEDLLEEIFGEIEDEYDITDITEKQLPDGSYVFSGKIEIDYLNEKYDFNLKASDEYETLAGYLLYLHESFPNQGEIIRDPDYEKHAFQVLKSGTTRIELIKLIPAE
ncbi:MAG: hemolysin family protein [Candidatus Delongbacteria bacterium]|jgi:CBS domain containing-hemolysin-like protein|nr:hemolysin family protein [Candidatus Delongbacteria bacterium]